MQIVANARMPIVPNSSNIIRTVIEQLSGESIFLLFFYFLAVISGLASTLSEMKFRIFFKKKTEVFYDAKYKQNS